MSSVLSQMLSSGLVVVFAVAAGAVGELVKYWLLARRLSRRTGEHVSVWTCIWQQVAFTVVFVFVWGSLQVESYRDDPRGWRSRNADGVCLIITALVMVWLYCAWFDAWALAGFPPPAPSAAVATQTK